MTNWTLSVITFLMTSKIRSLLSRAIQLLKRNSNLDPRDQRIVEGILTRAGKMQAMIEKVLHYSKAGQIKATPKLVDMTALLADLKQQLIVAHEPLALTINIGVTPPIYGDETMIQQVFSNLLGNAVKYSGKTMLPIIAVSGEHLMTKFAIVSPTMA